MCIHKKLYEGKAKILYETDNPQELLQFFKDDASAFDGKKRGSIQEKGKLNNAISSIIFELLKKEGIPTHFIKKISDPEMLVKKVEIIPVEVVVRNIVAGSLSKRMGIEEGTPLSGTVVEYYYKNDDLGDPMINDCHIEVFNLASSIEIKSMKEISLRVNKILTPFFEQIGITLVDYKLEFGRYGSDIILADEISPDSCRLWDKSSHKKMDKDRFRRNLGKVEEAYKEVYERVTQGVCSQ